MPTSLARHSGDNDREGERGRESIAKGGGPVSKLKPETKQTDEQ